MKIPRNPGISESDITQNRFTAYVQAAVYHYRERYILRKEKRTQHEVSYEEQEPHLRSLPSTAALDFESADLAQAWNSLREKERIILLRHTINGETLTEIAADLKMPYVTVKAIFKRCKDKLKKELYK